MPKGGARNRSGPQPDPNSARSDRRGLKLGQLPSGGFSGQAPDFPIPQIDRAVWVTDEEGKRHKEVDENASHEFRSRELEVWGESWRTPQASMWASESWRWPTIAEFCRLKTVVEMEPDANASLVAQLHRFRDQIGLTPAGLRENGWSIVADELEPRRSPTVEVSSGAPVRRLRAVAGD